jgi:hypothetical protein
MSWNYYTSNLNGLVNEDEEREQLRTPVWLGRQDSNLGMAESKSA